MRLTILLVTFSWMTNLLAQEKAPTNKHFWYSMETTAPSEAVWEVWMDVPNWKTWDTGLKDASAEGPIQLGTEGTILSLEERTSKFEVVEFVEGESYTYKTKLPLGSLYVKRYLETTQGGTKYTHEVWFEGLTRGIFARAFGGKFRSMLPEVLQNIKNQVEDGSY